MTENIASLKLANIYQSIANYDFSFILSIVKTFSFLISAAAVVFLVVITYKARGLVKEEAKEIISDFNPPAEAVSEFAAIWQEIKTHVNSFNESEWKLAVIEADKFVDDSLKNAGFQGESMGERLMIIQPGQLLSLQELWDAHKLRNLLVHDINYKITHKQAVNAVESFERTLRELGAIE